MLDTSKLSNEVRYAIASNLGWDTGMDEAPYLKRIARMTPREALSCYLTWHGIIGYTQMILNALDELNEAERETEAA
mgnify:CR=1 FL=1